MRTFLRYAFWTSLTIILLLDVVDRLSSLPSVAVITLPPAPTVNLDPPDEPDINAVPRKTWIDL
jgi:hypothetical protein